MKIKEFQKLLKQQDIDFCILYNSMENKKDYNLVYFTQQNIDYGCLVISPTKVKLYVPGFEYYRIKDKLKGIDVVLSKSGMFASVHKEFTGTRIGIDKEMVSLVEYAKMEKVFTECMFLDVGDMCRTLRLQKTPAEMSIVRKASKISDDIVKGLFDKLGQMETEQDIDRYLRTEVASRGLLLSFDPIVATGKNAYYPHHEPDGTTLNGFCIIDFGIKYQNYCTDMTRTVFFGKPTKKDQAQYDAVLACQEGLIQDMKPGLKLGDFQKKCIGRLGHLGKYMIHAVGHSVGLEVHDPLPHKDTRRTMKMVSGMIYTVEPGIYIKGKLGIRIEDDVFLGKKTEVLTKTPKTLLSVER